MKDKTLEFTSKVSSKSLFGLDLSAISQCVVPNNTNDLEIQFGDTLKREKKEDCLVQITFHFPEQGDDEDGEQEELPSAQSIQQQIMDSGVLRSATGDLVIEFTKEEGNFTYPRGKYALQVSSCTIICFAAFYGHYLFFSLLVYFHAHGDARWTIFIQNRLYQH